jgi:outer membrane protein OmpA-like peptidoglycan-associated protein
MKRISTLVLTAAVATILSACSTTPKSIPELETARAIVPQVEASPRAGVAATNISEARKALDRANQLAAHSGKLDEVRYEANVAAKHAEIANEKILTAQAKEELDKGTADRAQVLLEARNREADNARSATDRARLQTDEANRAAELERQRASNLEQELRELQAKKTDRGMVLTLGDVLFDTGKATLKPGAYKTVDSVAKVLKEQGDRKVLIEGHTDSVGTDEYNQTLSEHRAQAVQTALLERGVATAQITAVGRGEAVPVASNDDAGGRQQNRRVEMVFTDSTSKTAADE